MSTGKRVDRLRNDERILRVAARLLACDPNASMQAIADTAGVVRRTVYRRYPTREALVTALTTAAHTAATAAVETFPGWRDGPDALRVLVAALIDFAIRFPVAVLEHDPVAGTPVDARIAEILGEGAKAGVLRVDLDPALLNGMLFGAVSTTARLHPDGDPRQLADGVVELLLDGIRPR
ncbi:TetR/AcrR family transcriptional regulator [Lentzea sp. HUAS12]|uniref:TetR/AcrR family transcriptional regulator n=1 Tax=Lentzea sp. HUAS12 TaxID=2951806 RepID=UPI0020A022B6|nr:TetR/AcrR family transcriptional regulator [Lentzea sp. HUAS12]USX56293.1 TetR/AcrR family transcriptional regulator [Lentzea sp. HUAS12]